MSNFDEQAVQYLLDELSPDDRRALEERIMSDGETFELMQAAEGELYDAYARGALDAARRRRFEERFLVTAEQRERLERARLLAERARDAARAESVASAADAGARPARRPFWRRPFAALGFGLVVAAAVIAVIVLRDRSGGRRGDEVVVVTLAAATRSPGVPTVAIGPEVGTIRFEIDAGDGSWSSYRARIVDARGAVVVEPRTLATPVLDVPASRLGPGRWELILEGIAPGDRIEPIGRYAFDVTP